MKTKLMVVALVLVCGAVAQAGLILSMHVAATPPTDAGKVAYELWVSGTGGMDVLSAIDIRVEGALWQVWKYDEETEMNTLKTPEKQSLTALGGKYTNDSHFLWPDLAYYPSGITVLRAGTEDRAGPYTVDRSKGTFLDEAVILLANTSNPAPVARIVLDTGGSATASGSMSDKSGVMTDFSVPIPEPATMALLGLGVVGVLAGRRRASRTR